MRIATRFQYKLKGVRAAEVRTFLLALSVACAAPPTVAPRSDALQTLLKGNYAAPVGFRLHAVILNWNIDRGKHLDAIKQQIQEQKPDVCIFQEVDLGARRTGSEDVAKE